MSLARIKKGDTVQVISGREKGKIGTVLAVLAEEERVLVEKLNLVKRHMKPNQKTKQGGIVEKEAPIAISAVMPYCPKCKKGVRVATKILKDDEKVRTCAVCEEKLGGKK